MKIKAKCCGLRVMFERSYKEFSPKVHCKIVCALHSIKRGKSVESLEASMYQNPFDGVELYKIRMSFIRLVLNA